MFGIRTRQVIFFARGLSHKKNERVCHTLAHTIQQHSKKTANHTLPQYTTSQHNTPYHTIPQYSTSHNTTTQHITQYHNTAHHTMQHITQYSTYTIPQYTTSHNTTTQHITPLLFEQSSSLYQSLSFSSTLSLFHLHTKQTREPKCTDLLSHLKMLIQVGMLVGR